MKHHTDNSEAVSPVIGVILMIAVTIMLTAIVAAFVFGMAGGDMKSGKVVSIVPHRVSATEILFTNYGGSDAAKLDHINLTAYETGNTTQTDTLGTAVASSTKISGTFDGNNRVVAVGTFLDGTVSVLLDATI